MQRMVSQLQKNELGAGATLREAKGIMGALCKSRTPTDRSCPSLALPGHAALRACAIGKCPGRETDPAPRARLRPSVTFSSHACVLQSCACLYHSQSGAILPYGSCRAQRNGVSHQNRNPLPASGKVSSLFLWGKDTAKEPLGRIKGPIVFLNGSFSWFL